MHKLWECESLCCMWSNGHRSTARHPYSCSLNSFGGLLAQFMTVIYIHCKPGERTKLERGLAGKSFQSLENVSKMENITLLYFFASGTIITFNHSSSYIESKLHNIWKDLWRLKIWYVHFFSALNLFRCKNNKFYRARKLLF